MMDLRKKRLICALCALAVLVAAAAGWLIYEGRMDKAQQEALAELERNAGQYDEQSIVLHNTSKAKAQELAKLYGAKLRITEDGSFATLTLPAGTTIRDIYALEESRAHIGDMAADYQVQVSELTEEESGEKIPTRPQYSVSDPDYALQTYLDYLNMGDSWMYATGSGATVAVIDSGIDTDHPEFAGRISEYSYNATEDKIVKDYLLEDGSYDWSLVEDEQGHGTAVTGVIAAAMDGQGTVGIAPNAQIIVIKAECNEAGAFTRLSDLVFGLYYAIERDAQVVNMSFGVQMKGNPFEEAVQLAYDSDIICVAATGNDTTSALTWPAADEHVIGVGALDGWDIAAYSNYGDNVDMMAPGTTYTTTMGGGYGTKTGTSMASPIVAGAIAMYLQQNMWITFDELTEELYASSCDLGIQGRDWYYGFGALDIRAFLQEARGTVTYDMLTDEVDDMEGVFIQGHALQEFPEPERLYAVFDGWYYDATCTQEVDYYNDAFTGNVTLYAKWVNEDDGVPYTYAVLEDNTIQITGYIGHRRYITIPEMIDGMVVSSIGPKAFSNQTRLREVNLPAGLTEIGEYAFSGCSNLLSIQIPKNVTSIGGYAFQDNVRLTYVVFESGSRLETIDEFAFTACSSLETIELPASLKSVDGSVFAGATSLHSIQVQKGNAYFASNDGVLFNLAGDTLVAFPAAKSSTYTIPDGTTTIGNYAFAYSKLTAVDLEGVQSLGMAAFCYNTSLTDLNLGSTLTVIPKAAFTGCGTLRQLTIPKGITELGMESFSFCGLQQVTFEEGSSLHTIGSGAFFGCAISEIDIPASVVTIVGGAFSGPIMGNPLVRVSFAADSKLELIGEGAFAKCWLLETIELPASLQTIGSAAFQSSGLTKVTIPAAVTTLGDGAFSCCSTLTAITVEAENTVYHDIDGVVYNLDNTTIHAYPGGMDAEQYALEETTQVVTPWAFAGAENLMSVYLPEALTQIGEYSFSYCSGLQYMWIPDNVIQIGRYAFANDWSLSSVSFNPTSKLPRLSFGAFAYCGIYDFTVPANVSTMAQEVFLGCTNLTSITFAENSKLESISAYMFSGCDRLMNITFASGSALTSIQAHGLEGMSWLTSIDFGDAKLTNIDNFAFRFCENLTELTIPETVTNIGRYAFYQCSNLSQLTVPAGVEHIGSYAFLGTNDLELYLSAETMPAYLDENWDHGIRGYYSGVSTVEEKGDYKYAVMSSGDIAILEYLGSDTHVDLTKADLGGTITIIGGSAFQGSGVQSIVLPSSLTIIQAEAFLNSQLESITIPASVNFIGREAFMNTPLTEVVFAAGSQLTVMEQYAFRGTAALKTVTLPASLTTMGTGAFQSSGLQSVVFADGIALEEIPQNAFTGTNLTSVTLPDSVKLVDHNAFSGVTSLKSVTFGNADSIQLMSNAFYNTGLTDLYIPANVTYIGEYCFVALDGLTAFEVDALNPNYTAVDGLLMSKDQRKLIAVPAGRTGSLTVPETVEVIGFGAFEGSKLTQVLFHEDANILTFGYRAFFRSAITEITIPASVVSVDYYAFAYCEALESVTFAGDNNLKGIYEGAFCGDINLEQVELPDSIVEISDFAFYGCTKLDEIPVSDDSTVKGVYDYAFAYTGIHGDFTTPETLIDIGDYAFLGTKITSLTIPETNKKDLIIGIGAFEECNQLTSVTLPFVGASFEDEEISWIGYIFGAGTYYSNNLFIPESLKTVTITEGLTTLYRGAFYDVDAPERLYLPESLTTVYSYSFHQTGAMFELASPISLGYDHDRVFFGRWFDESNIFGTLTLAEGTEVIEGFLFNGCTLLKTVVIPEGVTTIKMAAFQGGAITTITIPSTVTTIEDYAFSGCEHLKKVINHSNLDIYPGDTGNGAVAEYAVTVIDSQGNVLGKEGDTVYLETEEGFLFEVLDGQYTLVAYTGKENTVTLPVQVNGQSYRIYGFQGAANVIVPGELKQINDEAFFGSKLTSIVISEGITEIGNHAFNSCVNLRHVTLPDSLTRMGDYAFKLCEKLKELTIPKNVSEISANTFNCCRKLELTLDKENPYFVEEDDVLYDAAKTKLIHASYQLSSIVIPNTVVEFSLEERENLRSVIFEEGSTLETIPTNAFMLCTALESVTLPDSVTYIDSGAFQACTTLKTIELPKNLTRLGNSVFGGCAALESITLPDSIEMMEYGAFASCSKLKEVNLPASLNFLNGNPFCSSAIEKLIIPDGMTNFKLIDGMLYNQDMTVLYAVMPGTTEITISGQITEIAWGAFEGCASLSHVVFEEGITTIPGHCFAGCNLDSVTLPSTIEDIGDWAFYDVRVVYNNSDRELTFGSEDHGAVAYYAECIVDKNGNATYNFPEDAIVTEDGFVFDYVDGQYRLVGYIGGEDTVTLPLTYNGEPYVIYEMTGVRNVIIPEGFTRIHHSAFFGCYTLESVVIPDTVTVIDGYAFVLCRSLKSVVIPDSVEFIGTCAFSGCTSLTSVTIPDTVDMGEYPFDYTGYINDPANWENGGCYLNKTLIAVDPSLTSFTVREGTTGTTESAFYGAYLLEYLDLGEIGNADLRDSMNLKTMVLGAAPAWGSFSPFFAYSDSIPLTLENIIISEDVVNSQGVLEGITGRNIFVTATEDDTRWDDNFPGWSAGNRVSYAPNWIMVRFYDHNGELLSITPTRTAQVIRRPAWAVEGYGLLGWDLDGDGNADNVPATSAVDVEAHALVEVLHDHVYESTVVAPTCTEPGYTQHQCIYCEENYIDSHTDALGHSYAATWSTDGDYHWHECATCGDKADHDTHDFGTEGDNCIVCDYLREHVHRLVFMPGMDATCTEVGNIAHYLCTGCGALFEDGEGNVEISDKDSVIIPALGHLFTTYISDGNVSCTEDETETAICGRCGHPHTRIVEGSALGHDYVDGFCSRCGEAEYVLGDINGDGEIDLMDANLAVAYYNETADLTDTQYLAADVDGNGDVDLMDANMIVGYYNETVDSFPANAT